MRNKIVAGNWKMNLSLEPSLTLASEVVHMYGDETPHSVEVILAPSFPFLSAVHHLVKHQPTFGVAAQNVSENLKGAFTGEVSGSMIASTGAAFTLIGHSERRMLFGETNEKVLEKIKVALQCNLRPIVCVGETLEERESGNTFEVIRNQLLTAPLTLQKKEMEMLILAYEPVWAIGTGKTATPEQAQEVHAFIRSEIAKKFSTDTADAIRILYGGSVTAENATALFSQPDIDGGLVGGASLKSREFVDIIKCAEALNKA